MSRCNELICAGAFLGRFLQSTSRNERIPPVATKSSGKTVQTSIFSIRKLGQKRHQSRINPQNKLISEMIPRPPDLSPTKEQFITGKKPFSGRQLCRLLQFPRVIETFSSGANHHASGFFPGPSRWCSDWHRV